MGIEVLPPDVNQSGHDFKVVDGNIRFGLDAVKGLGYQAVEAIIQAREEEGPFNSVWDFCRRVDCQAVNKKASDSLVKCGAFDSLAGTRTGMMDALPRAQAAGAAGAGGRAQRAVVVLRSRRRWERTQQRTTTRRSCRCRTTASS